MWYIHLARAIAVQQKDETVADEVGQDPTPVESVEAPQTEATPSFSEFSKAREASSSAPTPEPGNSQQVQEQAKSGINPVWEPVRQALGEDLFNRIKPNLSEWDTAAQKRVTEVNSKYEPWKRFSESGLSPEVLERAHRIVQGIDSNPLQAYEALGKALREQGIELPGVNAGQQDEDGEDPRDAELRSLREQNEQIVAFLNAQQAQEYEAQLSRQADSALDKELSDLRAARPNLTREEEGALLQQYALHLRAGNFDVSLERLAAESDANRNRILSQPRPNDFAPRLPGSGGTAPSATPNQKDPSQYSREESQALMADMLRRANRESA